MSKCEICGNELKGIETTNWFNGLCEKCWQEKHYVEYPFKKRISEKDKQIAELKQQLHDLPKKIVSEIKDCLLDFSNGWWRYFMTDGCEYMLSSDLQGCLDETIDTILKKYGGEDE